jgi:hypothetical protein
LAQSQGYQQPPAPTGFNLGTTSNRRHTQTDTQAGPSTQVNHDPEDDDNQSDTGSMSVTEDKRRRNTAASGNAFFIIIIIIIITHTQSRVQLPLVNRFLKILFSQRDSGIKRSSGS